MVMVVYIFILGSNGKGLNKISKWGMWMVEGE